MFMDPNSIDVSLLPNYYYKENGELKIDSAKFEAHQANKKKTRRFYMSARMCLDCFHTDKNPFKDGSEIEDFIEAHYEEISEAHFENVDLTKPSNLYKFLVLKTKYFTLKEVFKKEEINKLLKTYKKFMPQEVSFTQKERGQFKAAIATIKLMALVPELNRPKTTGTKSCCSDCDYGIQVNIDLHKLKSICNDLLEGYPNQAALQLLFLILTRNFQSLNGELTRFVICVIYCIMRKMKTLNLEYEEHTKEDIPKHRKIAEFVIALEVKVEEAKLGLLNEMFMKAHMIRAFEGRVGQFQDQEEAARSRKNDMLMQLFDDKECENDPFYKIPLKISNKEEAKVCYDIMIKICLNETRQNCTYENCNCTNIAIQMEGCAHGFYAQWQTESSETNKLCDKSNTILEKIMQNRNNFDACAYTTALVLMDINLAILWKVKLSEYKATKQSATLKEARELGTKRLNAGKEFLNVFGPRLPQIYFWWTYLDFIKLEIQLNQNVVEAKKYAELIFDGTKMNLEGMELHYFLAAQDIPAVLLNDRQGFIKRLIQICK